RTSRRRICGISSRRRSDGRGHDVRGDFDRLNDLTGVVAKLALAPPPTLPACERGRGGENNRVAGTSPPPPEKRQPGFETDDPARQLRVCVKYRKSGGA